MSQPCNVTLTATALNIGTVPCFSHLTALDVWTTLCFPHHVPAKHCYVGCNSTPYRNSPPLSTPVASHHVPAKPCYITWLLISCTGPLYKNLVVACCLWTNRFLLTWISRKEGITLYFCSHFTIHSISPHQNSVPSVLLWVRTEYLSMTVCSWCKLILYLRVHYYQKGGTSLCASECLHTNTAMLVRYCSGWGFKVQFLKISNLKFIFGEKEKFVSEIKRNKQERLTQNISSLFVTFLFQDPNTKRFKRVLIHFDIDTQYAHFWGNFLCQARKQHLNNK